MEAVVKSLPPRSPGAAAFTTEFYSCRNADLGQEATQKLFQLVHARPDSSCEPSNLDARIMETGEENCRHRSLINTAANIVNKI